MSLISFTSHVRSINEKVFSMDFEINMFIYFLTGELD